MPSKHLLASVLMIAIWIMASLHLELEGAGLLPPHAHHPATHEQAHGHTHGHATDAKGDADHQSGSHCILTEHESPDARGASGPAKLLTLLTQVASSGLLMLALGWLFKRTTRPRSISPHRPWFEDCPWARGPSAWRFLHRCAVDSLAPPLPA